MSGALSRTPWTMRRVGNAENSQNTDVDLYEVLSAKGVRLAGPIFKRDALAINAAPELLDVVKAMATFDGRNNNAALKEMARAAIAKATGAA